MTITGGMTITDTRRDATTSPAWWRTISAWGGILAVCGGIFHTVAAALMRSEAWAQIFAEGFFGTVSLAPSPDRLALAEAFWFSLGSFGVPLLLLGALVVQVTRRGEIVPGWLGIGVVAWAVLIGLMGKFGGGTLILITIGTLLAVGGWAARRRTLGAG